MSKRKLLLADDSITIQKVVNLTFADEGIEVVAVGDGDSAMEKINESLPDLILADVNMPGLSGYEICEQIKQNAETKSIPVILLVGSFEPFDEAKAERIGADDYLTKPFQSIRQLVNKVTDLLEKPAAAAPSGEETQTAAAEEDWHYAETQEIPKAQIETIEFGDAAMDDEMIDAESYAVSGSSSVQPSQSDFSATETVSDATEEQEAQETAEPKRFAAGVAEEKSFDLVSQDEEDEFEKEFPTLDETVDYSETEPEEIAVEETVETSETIYDFAKSEDELREDFEEKTETAEETTEETTQETAEETTEEIKEETETAEETDETETSEEITEEIKEETTDETKEETDETETETASEAVEETTESEENLELGESGVTAGLNEQSSEEAEETELQTSEADGELSPDEAVKETEDEDMTADTGETSETSEDETVEEKAEIEQTDESAEEETSAAPETSSALEVDEMNLLELPPLVTSAAKIPVAPPVETKPEIRSFAETEPGSDSAIKQEIAEAAGSSNLSPEMIEAIAAKVAEKLSDKAIKEIAWEVVPQMTELIIKKMAEEKEGKK